MDTSDLRTVTSFDYKNYPECFALTLRFYATVLQEGLFVWKKFMSFHDPISRDLFQSLSTGFYDNVATPVVLDSQNFHGASPMNNGTKDTEKQSFMLRGRKR